jgi:hypothetical protein
LGIIYAGLAGAGEFGAQAFEERVDGGAYEAGVAGAFTALEFGGVGLGEGN